MQVRIQIGHKCVYFVVCLSVLSKDLTSLVFEQSFLMAGKNRSRASIMSIQFIQWSPRKDASHVQV